MNAKSPCNCNIHTVYIFLLFSFYHQKYSKSPDRYSHQYIYFDILTKFKWYKNLNQVYTITIKCLEDSLTELMILTKYNVCFSYLFSQLIRVLNMQNTLGSTSCSKNYIPLFSEIMYIISRNIYKKYFKGFLRFT